MTEKQWPADNIERRKVADLVPYARNSRTHSPTQVDQLAASIKEWGFTNPILIDETGTIIAGHGRVMAAQKLGLDELPCMTATGWTEAQRRAYVIADNKLALNADWDVDALKIEMDGLGELNFDLKLTGFDMDELAKMFDEVPSELGEGGDNYSRKIEAPIYEIKGEKPLVSALYNEAKANDLKLEIFKADLPPEIAAFLSAAADRHTVFDFRNIAEFYAHSDEATQSLMERSALVIIDFDKAIEEGFVKLAEGMMDQVAGIKADA